MTVYHVRAGGQGEGGTLPTLAAAAAVVRPGDEVVVGAGVYREQVSLRTDGVTWRAEQKWQAIIDGGWGGADYDDEFRIQVGIGAKVTFIGFMIRNCEGRGFYVGEEGSGSVIEDVRVDNTGTSAFVLGDCQNVVVRRVVATRMGMAWEAGRRPSVAGSVILVRAEDCLVEDCLVAYGHGEGINLGRGSRRCVVRGNVSFDNSHLCSYINRAVECTFENNILFLTGEERRNAGEQENWPAGLVIGDEGSRNMQKEENSRGNIVRGNLIVNCGTGLHIRNNGRNYNTSLDAATRIEHNTIIGGALSRVGVQIDANEFDRPHGAAVIANNVIDMGHARDGAAVARGGGGAIQWRNNAWSAAPGDQASSPQDVVGNLGLANAGATVANEFPAPGHNLDADNYRPRAGSALIGAGADGATIGALDVVGEEPPEEPEPPLETVDWDALIARAAALGVQLATATTALADAREQVAAAALGVEGAAGELAALLERLDEYNQAA